MGAESSLITPPKNYPHPDPDGDLTLLVGPEQVPMKVQSSIMIQASKVFKTLLSKEWREGKQLAEQGHLSHALEEVEVDALRYICFALHQRQVLTLPLLEDLEQIAEICDYYDLSHALQKASNLEILSTMW